MVLKLPLHLNIRQKIIAGFTLLVIVIGSVGAVSYHHLLEVERKQHFVEIADDLHNFILEARRHEKNFLLYNSAGDLEESLTYSGLGKELLKKISPEVKAFKGLPLLDEIQQEMTLYSRLVEQIARENTTGSIPASMETQLREHGKALVDLSERLVSFERKRILNIVDSLKKQLLLSLALIIILGGLLVPVVSSKILRPLRVIEETTLQIAQGDFRTIPVRDTRDETQRVVEGFNRMISELEKRQEQLLQAKKLCSLGTLTSGIAHQLNNPLNNISTSCQILLEEYGKADGEFSLKMLTNIEGEVHRARDIVRGLLEFSRIKEFCLAPTPLSEVVERSISLISSQLPPGVQIIRNVQENLSLDLDANRMQQVFLNLIENAIHAIEPPGEVRISAYADTALQQVIITVEDTGSGISETDIGSIFDPFFTTKEVGFGTGLGLSIVFGIIQKHQGAIAVTSRENEGTQFIIRLPLGTMC